MKIQIKKLHPDAVIPKYATEGAAGFDLVAIEDVKIPNGQTKLVKTGLSVSIPRGFELQVRPRSGTSLNTSLRIANAPGTVDSDYRGEICIIMNNIEEKGSTFNGVSASYVLIRKGERVAQGVICPVFQAEFDEVEELDSTARGAGGFGSTGK